MTNRAIGLALSGGGVRGLAHIGVIKALAQDGWRFTHVAGTSAGSLIGAGLAAGMDWQALAEMARAIFWPSLISHKNLMAFCERHLPPTFADLQLPFVTVATEFPMKRMIALTEGNLASALSASCALRILRRPVWREGLKLKDGGYTCVLPVKACHASGAERVCSSDVWELSALLGGIGCSPLHPLFPAHYREAVQQSEVLFQPRISPRNYWPGMAALPRLIAAGEEAVWRAFEKKLV
jgi:NTE family protein